MSKPDAKKMAGEYPDDWATFTDLEEGSIMAETTFMLIAKAKMLAKRYKGKHFNRMVVEDVSVDDLGVHCIFTLGNVGVTKPEDCKKFEREVNHIAKTYFNLKPAYEYNFRLWK